MQAGSARHHVCIAMREEDDVSLSEPHWRLPDDASPAISAGDHVVLHHVLGAGQHHGRDLPGRGRLGRPLARPLMNAEELRRRGDQDWASARRSLFTHSWLL